MAEQIPNNSPRDPTTTLRETMTADALTLPLTLPVVTEISGMTPDYRLEIGVEPDVEYVKVTSHAGIGAGDLGVERAAEDAAQRPALEHPAGTPVRLVLTKGGLAQRFAENPGPAGADGVDGADGADGHTPFLTGTTAPTAGDGVDGDYWFWAAAGLMYGPKAAGAWPAGVSVGGRKVADAVLSHETFLPLISEPYVVPDGMRLAYIEIQAAGGGGGGAGGAANNAAAGGGGTSGSYTSFWLPVEPGQKLGIAAESAGGAGGSTAGSNGITGDEIELQVLDADDNLIAAFTVPGGRGGAGMAAGTGNKFAIGGLPASSGSFSMESQFGGEIGLRMGVAAGESTSGNGAGSVWGVGGGGRTIAGTGNNASGFGAGGAGGLAIGASGKAGGVGAPGAVRAHFYS